MVFEALSALQSEAGSLALCDVRRAGGAGQPASLGHAAGAGGASASAGSAGATAAGSTSGGWTRLAAGSGGVAGYAIRKNDHTVGVTNNGTITGTVG